MNDARIYIADQRGELEITGGWVRSTLNYDAYMAPYREAVGKLLYVNEWEGQRKVQIKSHADTVMVLLPLVSDICIRVLDEDYEVHVGEIFFIPVATEDMIHVSLPGTVEGRFVFQQLTFSCVLPDGAISPKQVILSIVGEGSKRGLWPVLQDQLWPFQFYVGAFVTKEEYDLSIPDTFDKTFSYTLDGCFEVQKRLLFAGDGLILFGQSGLDVECLSARGLILVVAFR